jgi:large subunit ribosomal protein L30
VTTLRITQVRSSIGTQDLHRGTLRALGLRGINRSVTHTDSPQLRGMLRKVSFLVRVEEAPEESRDG